MVHPLSTALIIKDWWSFWRILLLLWPGSTRNNWVHAAVSWPTWRRLLWWETQLTLHDLAHRPCLCYQVSHGFNCSSIIEHFFSGRQQPTTWRSWWRSSVLTGPSRRSSPRWWRWQGTRTTCTAWPASSASTCWPRLAGRTSRRDNCYRLYFRWRQTAWPTWGSTWPRPCNRLLPSCPVPSSNRR